MDAAEYKHLVLGLIFLKYISDTFAGMFSCTRIAGAIIIFPLYLSPGEQAIFPISDIVKVTRQLVDDIRLGEEKNAKIFAVSTKGNRFESPAVIEVAK